MFVEFQKLLSKLMKKFIMNLATFQNHDGPDYSAIGFFFNFPIDFDQFKWNLDSIQSI